jgi:hypothetical protein
MLEAPMRPSFRRLYRATVCSSLFAAACLDGPTVPARPEPPAAIVVVSGDSQSAPAGEELPQPVCVKVTDRNGSTLVGVRVQFRVRAGGGRVREEYVTTDGTGIAVGHWVLGTAVNQIQQLESIIPAESGVTLSAMFTATVRPAAASQLVMRGGNNQGGMLGEVLPESLAVRVTDRYGNGVPDIAVVWSANGASGDTVTARSNSSDTSGVVKAAWRLGARLDVPHRVTVSAAGLTPITFSAAAAVPPTARLATVAGDAQRGPVGTALPESLVVRLTLSNGAPIQGATVQWAVSTGAGIIAPQATVTDATGIVKTEWVLGTAVVPNGVTATVSGLAPVTFSAQAIADTPASLEKVAGDAQHGVPGQLALDSLVVRMLDRHGNPVPAAVVDFSVTSGDGTVDPARTTTDADGRAATRFRLGSAGSANAVTATGDNGPSATFLVEGSPGSDWKLTVTAGSGLSVAAGAFIDLQVRLSDGADRPLQGATVEWSATDGGRPEHATTMTGADGIASNGWTVACGLRTQFMTATVTGMPPATLSATTTYFMPPWLASARGLPQSAPAYSTHEFVTFVEAFGCPVSGVEIPFVALTDLSRPPTGLHATSGLTDDAGLALSSVTLGGYLGAQCANMPFHPPYDNIFCITATVSTFSTFRIMPDSFVMRVGSRMDVRLDARDPDGRPVWGASWRSLDTSIVEWLSNLDYTATVFAMRAGTGWIVATLGDRSDTALVRVEPPPEGSTFRTQSAERVVMLTYVAQSECTLRRPLTDCLPAAGMLAVGRFVPAQRAP